MAAAWAAGVVLMRSFRAVDVVRMKGPDQPVTDADMEADAVLADRLLRDHPEYGWLSEETVDRPDRLARGRVWIVDPLDGTRSYIRGYPEFAVSIALVVEGIAELGVVYNPAGSELFWAVRGGGAFRAGPWDGGPAKGRRLTIPGTGLPARPSVLASRTEIGRGEFQALEARFRVEPLGSTAYKLAGVAAGLGDLFLSRGPKSEWDVAAGALIVQEAGGVVTDLNGSTLRYNRPDPYVHGVLAASPALHGEILEMVAALPSPRLRAGGADGRGED